jgi:hypothetical protein
MVRYLSLIQAMSQRCAAALYHGMTSVMPRMSIKSAQGFSPSRFCRGLEISPGPEPRAEKHTSGAKARIDSIGFMPGMNPRPTARRSFSAACEGVP